MLSDKDGEASKPKRVVEAHEAAVDSGPSRLANAEIPERPVIVNKVTGFQLGTDRHAMTISEDSPLIQEAIQSGCPLGRFHQNARETERHGTIRPVVTGLINVGEMHRTSEVLG